jgi:hypothetical protein
LEGQELPINFVFDAKNPKYKVVVRAYTFGQFRLQLCEWFEENIVREACTYDRMTAIKVKDEIAMADDPEAYLNSLAKPWNCEYPNGRIRLDNMPPISIKGSDA